ncbi:MAG: WXG100 family type VII secretion target [Anaerolineales bacterium]
MTDRVLSTETAKMSITEMQRIINSGLVEQLDALNRQGQTLSDPNVWDGRLATQFREDWRQTYSQLQTAKQALEELRSKIQRINENIMSAGGNA